MSRKAYYNTGASLMRSHARQYKDREDNTARIATAVDNIVPRNYAAFALVLSRHFGFTQEQIADIITWTQELYNESLFEDLDIFSNAAMKLELICMARFTPRSTELSEI